MTGSNKLSDDEARQARYAMETQDAAYQGGAYDYLESIDLSPRMAVMGAYVRHCRAQRLLDVGCGFADLLNYLDPAIAYTGVDVSATAIDKARKVFAARGRTEFHVINFRDWQPPAEPVDAVVWAGIARSWTEGGRKGDFADWLDIIALAERALRPGGVIIVEMVAVHWPELMRLIAGRYEQIAGCDLDCLTGTEESMRSIRVFRTQ